MNDESMISGLAGRVTKWFSGAPDVFIQVVKHIIGFSSSWKGTGLFFGVLVM